MTLGAAALNLLLSLAMAPRWGGLGVAAATATTLILLNVANVAAARRRLGVRTFVYLRRQEWAEVARLLATGRRRPPA